MLSVVWLSPLYFALEDRELEALKAGKQEVENYTGLRRSF